MRDEIKLFYDINALKISNDWIENCTMMPNIKEFIDILPDRPKVLDLGCGPGYESMRLSSLGADVVGIDFSEESIRVAREHFPDVKFIVQDFRYLNASIGSFDGVFACASLIHNEKRELPIIFEGIKQILKPNGYIMVVLRDGNGVLERPYKNGNEDLIRRIFLHTKEDFSAIAIRHGFKFVSECEIEDNVDEYRWKCYVYQNTNRKTKV